MGAVKLKDTGYNQLEIFLQQSAHAHKYQCYLKSLTSASEANVIHRATFRGTKIQTNDAYLHAMVCKFERAADH